MAYVVHSMGSSISEGPVIEKFSYFFRRVLPPFTGPSRTLRMRLHTVRSTARGYELLGLSVCVRDDELVDDGP
jgi:hypothetical protein